MRSAGFAAVLVTTLFLVACGSDDDAGEEVQDLPQARAEGPVTAGNGIVLPSTTFDLGEVGYMREEYFVSGDARAFRPAGELGEDGLWQIEPSGESANYHTRIVVHRPIDESDFNGVVFVEWLNVSAGFDSAPDWIYSHVELIRRGYAWVGVSAQIVGIEGGGLLPIANLDLSLRAADPERYGDLFHPGDSYSYDIFSQVGRMLRRPGEIDPLGGLSPQHVIAAGESQSAWRLVTYVNAFARSERVFDGYLIHSRPGGATSISEEPLEVIATPPVVRIRDDLDVPVMMLQSETDLIELGSAADRQQDSQWIRLWEIAGTAHADVYTLLVGMGDRGDDPRAAQIIETASPIAGVIECGAAINSGPHHLVLRAAIRALETWVREGVAPPSAPRLALDADGELVRDDLGNAVGGIRTPYVDVPIAQLRGDPPGGDLLCFLFGRTILFESATIDALYPDNASFASAVGDAAQEAVDAGFLLEEDAESIVSVYVDELCRLFDRCE